MAVIGLKQKNKAKSKIQQILWLIAESLFQETYGEAVFYGIFI